MKIALIGYGKMGKTIERIALERGHEIAYHITEENQEELFLVTTKTCEVAIEFTQPDMAYHNISTCLKNDVRVISGTTGWLNQYQEIKELTEAKKGTFLHSSNFSLGVNLFFELNKWLAEKMNGMPQFQLAINEIHHTEKLDKPSGTALRLAEGILEVSPLKNGWTNQIVTDQTKIRIVSSREPNVPGTHTVEYSSDLETIEIKHTAHSRDVFASGVLDVAEWIQNRTGVLTINDYLNDSK